MPGAGIVREAGAIGPPGPPFRRPAALALPLALALAWAPAGFGASADVAACAAGGGDVATLSGIAPDGDILLADGRRIALAGIGWPRARDPAPRDEDRARRILAWAAGRPVRAVALSSVADRWGRIAAHLVAVGEGGGPADGPSPLLAEALAREGLAVVRPGEVARPCARALLAAEDEARAERRGLWGDPATGVVRAEDRAALLRRAGAYALVEGRVLSIGESRTRAYLNFAKRGTDGFAAVIPKRALSRFEASGIRWTSLEGRRVRLRGVVVEGRGPMIEVAGPDDVARID